MKPLHIFLVVLLLVTTQTKAQNYFGLLSSGQQMVSAGLNSSPHLNAEACYMMVVKQPHAFAERYGIMAHANFPIFSQKGMDLDLFIGAGALIDISGDLKSVAGLSWKFSRTSDLNGSYVHTGFKFDLLPGYYGNKWVVAPHFALSYQPLINIRHKEYAKKAFSQLYPNGQGKYRAPVDGWFYQNNITIETGIGLAYVRPGWQVNFQAGFRHQPNNLSLMALPDIGIMPFYGRIHFGYNIGQ